MTKKTELTPAEKIALCGVVLLGRDYLTTAYFMSHPRANIKSESSLKVVLSRWWASELCKTFRTEIENTLADIKANRTGNDLRTRSGIVSELISATKQTQGKDSVNALQTLAKIQGLDRPEERPDDERRKFVLTWPSHCRTCALMRLYLDVKKKNKIVW